jgi:perosamine synthetase
MINKKIKLFDVHVGINDEKAVLETLKSHFWASGSGMGNVAKFEKNFNHYIKSKSCVTVNSGTAALELALSLADIKNKEVILPSLSFVSTAHAVIMNGGKPIFVDIEPNTLCIDPLDIEKHITNKTKVILPVHFGGMSCDLDKIKSICNKNNILLIEDAAHAAGAIYKKKKIGNHGFAVCFSFHPVKNLAMPTGGAITFNEKNSKKMKEIIQSRRWC